MTNYNDLQLKGLEANIIRFITWETCNHIQSIYAEKNRYLDKFSTPCMHNYTLFTLINVFIFTILVLHLRINVCSKLSLNLYLYMYVISVLECIHIFLFIDLVLFYFVKCVIFLCVFFIHY